MAADPSINIQLSAAQKFRGDLGDRSDRGLRTFPNQTLDLTSSSATTSRIYDVTGLSKISVRVQATTFGTAASTIQGSVDGANWTDLADINTTTREHVGLRVEGYVGVRLLQNTLDSGASTAFVFVHAYKAT